MHSHGLKFTIAGPDDDLIIRELLKRVSMNKRIGISLQREPNYFAGECIGAFRSTTFILTDENRTRAYALATRSVMEIKVNGVPTKVGYLSNLRSDPSVRGGRYLFYGFRFLRKLCEQDTVPYYFTTIFDDNIEAKSILESNRPGLPRYMPIGKLATYLIPLTRRIGKFSERVACIRQPDYEKNGLGIEESSYQISEGAQKVSVSVGDYSGYKQVVVTSYSKPMALIRISYNILARLRSLPKLPSVGSSIKLLYATSLSSQSSNASLVKELLQHVVTDMSRRGHDYLVLSLMSDNSLSDIVAKMAARKEMSTVYQVMWEDGPRLPTSNIHLEVVSL